MPLVRLNEVQDEAIDSINKKILNDTYQFENVDCVCGEEKFHVIATRDKFGLFVSNVICINCGLIRQNRRFTDASFSIFYNSEYRLLYTGVESVDNAPLVFSAQYEVADQYYTYISNNIEKTGCNMSQFNNVLEIGCSAGGILKFFSDQGHNVKGVDYDQKYINYGAQQGLDLICGNVDSVLGNGKFDLVVMAHVFEHVLDIHAMVGKLSRLLRDGGYLFINVPGNLNNDYYKYEKSDFLYYLQGAHVYSFTMNTLKNVFSNSCFEWVSGDERVFSILRNNGARYKNDDSIVNDYDRQVSYIRRIEI